MAKRGWSRWLTLLEGSTGADDLPGSDVPTCRSCYLTPHATTLLPLGSDSAADCGLLPQSMRPRRMMLPAVRPVSGAWRHLGVVGERRYRRNATWGSYPSLRPACRFRKQGRDGRCCSAPRPPVNVLGMAESGNR